MTQSKGKCVPDKCVAKLARVSLGSFLNPAAEIVGSHYIHCYLLGEGSIESRDRQSLKNCVLEMVE